MPCRRARPRHFTDALAEHPSPGEGFFERHLQVEDHADQKGEGIIDEVLLACGSPVKGRLLEIFGARAIDALYGTLQLGCRRFTSQS